jgi:hypothetical protein
LAFIAALFALAAGLGVGGTLIYRAYSQNTSNKTAEDDGTPKKPRFTISKETTYFTAPLDKDGYIDYEAAINERLGKGIKPESNAAVLLVKALGPIHDGRTMPARFYKMLGIAEPPDMGDYFIDPGRFAKETLKLDGGKATEEFNNEVRDIGQRVWSAEQHPRVAAWLKANERPLALVIEATKRKDYFIPIVTSRKNDRHGDLLGANLGFPGECRYLAWAFADRALLRLGKQESDSAWVDLLTCHRLARLVARGPTSIEPLVGFVSEQIACEADLAFLEGSGRSAKQIAKCLADLQALPPMPDFATSVDLYCRCEFLDIVMWTNRLGFWYLEQLSATTLSKRPTELQKHFQKHVLDDADFDPALRAGNRWCDRFVAAMRQKDYATRAKRMDEIEADINALRKRMLNGGFDRVFGTPKEQGELVGDLVVAIALPAISKQQQAFDRIVQSQRNLQIAFALAAYQRDNGKYPPTLAVLAPKYLAKIPDDLFTDKPLVYRPTETGYLLYSLGPNGKDDGGHGPDVDPKGDDIAVRMPLPKLSK